MVKRAGEIKARYMMIAGTSDQPHIDQTMKMARALVEAGVDYELVLVPQAFHHFIGCEEDFLLKKVTGWFEKHVKNRSMQNE